jgi:hypothetical protein
MWGDVFVLLYHHPGCITKPVTDVHFCYRSTFEGDYVGANPVEEPAIVGDGAVAPEKSVIASSLARRVFKLVLIN